MLEAQYGNESSPERRVAIIRIIGEHRHPQSLEFLNSVLTDRAPPIWQAALNGIVSIGGEAAEAVLRAALAEAPSEKKEWITEAISQLHQ